LLADFMRIHDEKLLADAKSFGAAGIAFQNSNWWADVSHLDAVETQAQAHPSYPAWRAGAHEVARNVMRGDREGQTVPWSSARSDALHAQDVAIYTIRIATPLVFEDVNGAHAWHAAYLDEVHRPNGEHVLWVDPERLGAVDPSLEREFLMWGTGGFLGPEKMRQDGKMWRIGSIDYEKVPADIRRYFEFFERCLEPSVRFDPADILTERRSERSGSAPVRNRPELSIDLYNRSVGQSNPGPHI
jgi:hypothetical protein